MSIESTSQCKHQNLFEQFVILGMLSGESTLFHKNTNELQIIVKDVYPKDTQHRGYLKNLHMWCFNENTHIYDESGKEIDMASVQSKRDPQNNNNNTSMRNNKNDKDNNQVFEKASIQHFVITDEQGQKRYCTSLQIYELRKAKLREADPIRFYYVPKAYAILSSFNHFEVHRQLLSYLLKVVIHPRIQGNYKNSVMFTDKQISTFEKYAHNYGFKEAQKMPLCQASQDTSDTNSKEQQHIRQVKEEYILGFVLSQLKTLPRRNKLLSKQQLILRLDSQDIFSYKPSNSHAQQSEFLKLDNFSYKPLLQKLSIPSIVEFLKAILLEKQIIIFAKDLSEVAHLCEAIFTFIKPLQWRCVYIPSLPNNMLDTLDIIVPYIIGVQRSMKDQILRQISAENKLFLDLDTDFIIQDGIEMPVELKNNFQEQLKIQMNIYKECYKGKTDKTCKTSSVARQEQSESFTRLILNVKKVFLHFMMSLVNNYTGFFLFPDDFDYQRNINKEIFDFKAYFRFMGPSLSPFYADFASKTMIFRGLIEDSYQIVRQMAVFGKDIEEAGQLEGAESALVSFMLEIKKAAASMRLKEQTNVGVCNVNLYRQKELLSTLHLEHNIIIANYLQELSKPQIIETKGELLKYLFFAKTNSHSPFKNDSCEIPRQGIALEKIESAPILNLEEIQNQADIAINAKSEKSKAYYPTDLKGGPRISHQISFTKEKQQIQKESSSSQIIDIQLPQANRTILESSKNLFNMQYSGELLQDNLISTPKQIISRETRTYSLSNNVSNNNSNNNNNSQNFGKTFYANTQTSPYLITRESMPHISAAPTTATTTISEYYSEEKRKRKIFEQVPQIKSRESGYGVNTTKNEISCDEEFKRSRESGWNGQNIEGLRGEDIDDLPNRSDIPEENTVETVPDFFRGDLEMKNIVALNIDQITSCHSFRDKPVIAMKPTSQFSRQHISTLPGEDYKSLDIKNQFFSTENCWQKIRDLEDNKLNISLKTPFSVAGPVEGNSSWRLSSEMNTSCGNFFTTQGQNQIQQKAQKQHSSKTEYRLNTQPTLLSKQDHSMMQSGMPTFSQDKQQKAQSTSWALKKCDYFHTENVQEEEETESIAIDHVIIPKMTPPGVAVIPAPNVAFKTQNGRIEKQNVRIKDDPVHLKEYFSHETFSQIKVQQQQQQQPLSSRNMNQISFNQSSNQITQVSQIESVPFNQNKKGEDEDRIKKCNNNNNNNNSSLTNLLQIQQQQQISSQNHNLAQRSQQVIQAATLTSDNYRTNTKITTTIKNYPNLTANNENVPYLMQQQPAQYAASINLNHKQNNNTSNTSDAYSKLTSKPTVLSQNNPLKESASINIISHKHTNSKDLYGNSIKILSKQIVNTTQNPYMDNNSQRRSLDREGIPTQLKPSRSSLDSNNSRYNYVHTENTQDKQYLVTNTMNVVVQKGPIFFKQKGNTQKFTTNTTAFNKENNGIQKYVIL